MFPEPPRPKLTLSQHYRNTYPTPPMYGPYTGKTRLQCDECLWCLHEAQGVGQPVRSARVRRIAQRDGEQIVMLLCNDHANLWREKDGR